MPHSMRCTIRLCVRLGQHFITLMFTTTCYLITVKSGCSGSTRHLQTLDTVTKQVQSFVYSLFVVVYSLAKTIASTRSWALPVWHCSLLVECPLQTCVQFALMILLPLFPKLPFQLIIPEQQLALQPHMGTTLGDSQQHQPQT